MDKPVTIYKIRDKSYPSPYYSHGIITGFDKERGYIAIKFSKKGKEWTSEKTVKDHLTKVIEKIGGIPSHWEIMEFTQQPSRELNDWIDGKMLVKMLKA